MVNPQRLLPRANALVLLGLLCVLGAARLMSAPGSASGAVTKVDHPSTSVTPPDAAPVAPAQPGVVPATGDQHIDIQIPSFGRYAIMAVGGSGSRITLVDRLAGPIAADGVPGQRQGRINAELEAGTWRVRVESPSDGLGTVSVEVRPYVEQSAPVAELLDGAMEEHTLSDLEERSWWVVSDGEAPLFLDVVGRSLSRISLWRDGIWAVNAPVGCDEIRDTDGNPSGRCSLVAKLEAGLYRVVAIGGPARPRGDGGGAEPLYIRRGAPTLNEASRPARKLSPFGLDRYFVPAAGRVRLDLGAPGLTSMELRGLRGGVLAGSAGRAVIAADARERSAALNVPNGGQILHVVGTPGQPYTLARLPVSGNTRLVGPVTTWISTVSAGNLRDELDTTAVVLGTKPQGLLAASAVEVSGLQPWHRRFNLHGSSELYIDVQTPGLWRFEGQGITFDVNPVGGGKPTPGLARGRPEKNTLTADLPSGIQRVRMTPDEVGLAEVAIYLDGTPTPTALSTPKPGVRLPDLAIDRGNSATVLLASQPGVDVALVREDLPALLDEPLPLVLGPRERLELSVLVKEPGEWTTDDPGVSLKLGDGAVGSSVRVGTSATALLVQNSTDQLVYTSIFPQPKPVRPSPPSALKPDLDRLPLLTPESAVAADLDQNSAAQWRVGSPEVGAWRIESTGLLALSGTLTDRAGAPRAAASYNGSGRNFRMDTLLPASVGILNVRTSGNSKGHYGLRMTRLPEIDGGRLRVDAPAWAEVRAGSLLRYRVEIRDRGHYALGATSPGAQPSLLLADADGWPMYPAGTALDDLTLTPGLYDLVALPMPGDAQVRAELRRLDTPAEPEGHGPFPLALGVAGTHTWWEPAGGAQRSPDLWGFHLPARVRTTISLSAGMVARLTGPGGAATEGIAGSWTGELDAGDWQIAVVSSTIDSGVPYTVSASPALLVAGGQVSAPVPGRVSIAVGSEGIYSLSSVSAGDVLARLRGPDGKLLWTADDRPGGWDFAHSGPLSPGAWTLELEAVSSRGGGQATIRMSQQEPRDHGALAAGESTLVATGAGDAWTTELGEGQVLVASAASAENVGLAVEIARDGGWRGGDVDQGTAPWVAARGPAKLRLRMWSLDERDLDARLRVGLGRAKGGEDALSLGKDGPRVSMALASGEILALSGSSDARICAPTGGACAGVRASRIAAGPGDLLAIAVHPSDNKANLSLSQQALDGDQVVSLLPGATLQGRPEGRGLRLLTLTSAAGIPLPSCTGTSCYADVRPDRAGGEARLLVPTDAPLRVSLIADMDEDLPTRLVARRFERVDEQDATLPWSGTLPSGGALRLRIPGDHALSVAMTPGIVLSAGRGQRAEVLAAPAEGLYARLAGSVAEILVVNPGDSPGALTLREAPPLEAADGLVQLEAEAAGLLVLPISGPGTLSLGGAADGLVAVGPAALSAGSPAAIADGPWSARVRHGAGPVAIWREAPGAQAAILRPATTETRLTGRSGRLPLSGQAMTIDLPAGQPGPLTIHAVSASALILHPAKGEGTLLLPDAGGRWDLLLGSEATRLTLRALGGAQLWGEASFELVPTGTAPSNGPGQGVLLAPGERYAWSVDLPEARTMTLGLRASPESARMLVLGPDGARLTDGLVGMLALPKGRSWLIARADPAEGPTMVRPVVAGREDRPAQPPGDVIRSYARLDGRLPAEPEQQGDDPGVWEGSVDTGEGEEDEGDTGGEQ